jgi:hypothetical protein
MPAKQPILLSPTEWAVLAAVHRSPIPATAASLKLILRPPLPDPEVLAAVLSRLANKGLLQSLSPGAWRSAVTDLRGLLRTQCEHFIQAYPSQVPDGLDVLRETLDSV